MERLGVALCSLERAYFAGVAEKIETHNAMSLSKIALEFNVSQISLLENELVVKHTFIMTSLVVWVGVDSRGPASFYFASDSRISWGNNLTWNYGRKLFASQKHPDVFGYCGDVLFPSLILGQLISMMDSEIIFVSQESPEEKFKWISFLIQQTFHELPQAAQNTFHIVYCSRCGEGMMSTFEMYTLEWNSKDGWVSSKLLLPVQSNLVLCLGSGRNAIRVSHLCWQQTEVKGTSRAVFSAFCDSLETGLDPYTGGAPQLVGLYRKGYAKNFGIIFKEQRYLLGLPINEANFTIVEWRNCLFERCDPCTKHRLPDAQPQPRPKSLRTP